MENKSTQSCQSEEQKTVLSPEESRTKLENMGYSENLWNRILEPALQGLDSTGSHQIQALIIIARSNKPEVLEDIYKQMKRIRQDMHYGR